MGSGPVRPGRGPLAARWAEAYVDFAAGEKRAWLHAQGHRLFPVVGWAERGDGRADGHGNSVPRFHITWGTGPGVVEPFVRRVRAARRRAAGDLRVPPPGRRARGRRAGTVDGVRGAVLAPERRRPRPAEQPRAEVGDFEIAAQAVVVTSGGIGGNHDLVPPRLAGAARGAAAHHGGRACPPTSTAGCSASREAAGGAGDQPRPDVALHRGAAQLGPDLGQPRHPDPARAVVAVARRDRQAAPRRRTSRASTPSARCGTSRSTGHDYSWFVLTQKIIEKEFALSGSEQNPDLTGKDVRLLLARAQGGCAGAGRGVQASTARTSWWRSTLDGTGRGDEPGRRAGLIEEGPLRRLDRSARPARSTTPSPRTRR